MIEFLTVENYIAYEMEILNKRENNYSIRFEVKTDPVEETFAHLCLIGMSQASRFNDTGYRSFIELDLAELHLEGFIFHKSPSEPESVELNFPTKIVFTMSFLMLPFAENAEFCKDFLYVFEKR